MDLVFASVEMVSNRSVAVDSEKRQCQKMLCQQGGTLFWNLLPDHKQQGLQAEIVVGFAEL